MTPLVRRKLCTCTRAIIKQRPYSTTTTTNARLSTDSLLKPIAADMIGTPDPVSNLRPVRYYVFQKESNAEKEWREIKEKVDKFNQNFWYNNNKMFINAKAEYEDILKQNGETVTPEALSIFYKDFLDQSYERQMNYNREWWKLNIGMLYPGMKAAIRWITQSKQKLSQQQKDTTFWEKSFES
ncbi:hypothetical protein INT45_004313 [Circinella minor]|uniref:Apoptogenic protein 1, mitochondrial n=1 Tax=Circinella minor TaxID=1195481 RepID=A0A8H7SF83_9FUNG|nr:hypothetical protein INT45_004313 [Circinella minor]